jgi:hypothetical protein
MYPACLFFLYNSEYDTHNKLGASCSDRLIRQSWGQKHIITIHDETPKTTTDKGDGKCIEQQVSAGRTHGGNLTAYSARIRMKNS